MGLRWPGIPSPWLDSLVALRRAAGGTLHEPAEGGAEGGEGGTSSAGPGARRSLLRWVLLLVVLYIVLLAALSVARYLEFSTGDWDLGTMQQALWSATHGHPFYEADDYEMSGIPSLFQVHPSFLLVALVVPYSLAPTPVTLLLLQAVAVGAAAIPLYFIATDVTGSERKAVLACALYLTAPLLISANLADVHLEAFLSLELFSLFLLWKRRRYLWGALPAFLAFVTIEVGPFLVGAVALYFLLPTIEGTLARAKARPEGSTARWGTVLKEAFRPLEPRATLALLLLSGLAYLVLRVLQNDPGLVLLAPVPVSGNPPIAVSSGDLHLVPLGVLQGIDQRVGFWLLAYALVGFLPLRALRTQVLVLPWFVYTFASGDIYTHWGLQYGFLPIFPLLIGVVYGLADLRLEFPLPSAWRRPNAEATSPTRPPGPVDRSPPRWDLWARYSRHLGAALLLLLVLNLALSPLDPLLQNHEQGSGYQVSYVIQPGFSEVQSLVAKLPPGAIVLATDDLFPFVANDVHAYTLFPVTQALRHLPFNATHLPDFVLYSAEEAYTVPGWILGPIGNGTAYHLLGEVASTPRGAVYLYGPSGAAATGRAWSTVDPTHGLPFSARAAA